MHFLSDSVDDREICYRPQRSYDRRNKHGHIRSLSFVFLFGEGEIILVLEACFFEGEILWVGVMIVFL